MTATSTNNTLQTEIQALVELLHRVLSKAISGLAVEDIYLSINTTAWQFINRAKTAPVYAGRSLKDIVAAPHISVEATTGSPEPLDSDLFDRELSAFGIPQAYILYSKGETSEVTAESFLNSHHHISSEAYKVFAIDVRPWRGLSIGDWEDLLQIQPSKVEKTDLIWRWLRHWIDPRMNLAFQTNRLARFSAFLTKYDFRSIYLVMPANAELDDARMFAPTTNWDYSIANQDGKFEASIADPLVQPQANWPANSVSLCELWLAAIQSAHASYRLEKGAKVIVAGGSDEADEVDEVISDFYVKRRRPFLFMLVHAPRPSAGFETLRQSGALDGTLSELSKGYGLEQNRYHKYDIYYHSIYACDASLGSPIHVRFAALFHDLGKVDTRKEKPDGEATFHNHELISVRHTVRILGRCGFTEDFIGHVRFLVRNHMFHYTGEWTDKAVRRFLRKVDNARLKEMVLLRLADRQGSGKRSNLPKAIQNLIEHVDKVEAEARRPSVKDLAIDGHDLQQMGLQPSPLFGEVLNASLLWMLDAPERNEKGILLEFVKNYISEKQPQSGASESG